MDWLLILQENIITIIALAALGLGLKNIFMRRKSIQELERELAELDAKPTTLNPLSWTEMVALGCWIIGGFVLLAFDSKVAMLFYGLSAMLLFGLSAILYIWSLMKRWWN